MKYRIRAVLTVSSAAVTLLGGFSSDAHAQGEVPEEIVVVGIAPGGAPSGTYE